MPLKSTFLAFKKKWYKLPKLGGGGGGGGNLGNAQKKTFFFPWGLPLGKTMQDDNCVLATIQHIFNFSQMYFRMIQ